jgi:DNA (cytosine-5)-methyltransferase 1
MRLRVVGISAARRGGVVTRPPYVLPTMAEIRQTAPNGHTVASTFSGTGGSSTGYRLAGFRVLWASEFVPAAAASYRANADPATVLDTRDIREVRPDELPEVDLLDGSPPCSDFSTQGNLSSGWGEVKSYSSTSQRVDDLFFEFARIAEGLRPKVLIAENVSGLVRGVSKGYFKLILARLRDAGYRVEARLLDASWLGAAQERKRIIFVGVRDDLAAAPAFPDPQPYRRTIGDALPDCAGLVWRWGIADRTRPCPTIQTSYTSHSELAVLAPPGTDHDPETGRDLHAGIPADRARREQGAECRRLTLGELRALAGFPPDFELTGSYDQRWERIGRAVPPVMMGAIAATVRDRILAPLEAA